MSDTKSNDEISPAELRVLVLGSGKRSLVERLSSISAHEMFVPQKELYQRLLIHGITETMAAILNVTENSSMTGALCDLIKAGASTTTLDSLPDGSTISAIKELWSRQDFRTIVAQYAAEDARASSTVCQDMMFLKRLEKYMDKFDEIVAAGYSPTAIEVADCCAIRQRIFEHRVMFDDDLVDLVHISYQRNEQRKWLHIMDDMDAILYLVRLSEYDECDPDGECNKLRQALNDFDHYVNNRYLQHLPVILLLTHKDQFQKKLQKTPLHTIQTFSDCRTDPLDYIIQKFTHTASSNMSSAPRSVYHHVSAAEDPELIPFLGDACQQIKNAMVISPEQRRHLSFSW